MSGISEFVNKKSKETNYVFKKFFSDFIVKEIFVLDQNVIKCDGNKFNINFEDRFDYNYTIKLGFCPTYSDEVKILYEKILKLQNEVQKYKESIIIKANDTKGILNPSQKDTQSNNQKFEEENDKEAITNNILKKIEKEKILEKCSKIKILYKTLSEILNNRKDVTKYFYLPEKQQRMEIYQNLRKNPTLIYEILEENTNLSNLQEISTCFSNSSDKILKITQTVTIPSQFHFTLKKINKTTSSAVGDLKNRFSNISFAGNKDKRGITFQRFSVKSSLKDLLLYNNTPLDLSNNEETNNDLLKLINEKIRTPALVFSQFVSCQKNIGLGDLKGNNFEITIREIPDLDSFISKLSSLKAFRVPNYFGPQRFGNKGNNHLIGKFLYEKSYSKAYELFADSNNKEILTESQSKQFFNKKLRREQKTLFEHAYQSHIFNCWVEYLINEDLNHKNDYTLNEEDFLYLGESNISLNKYKEITEENNPENIQNIQFKLPFTGKNNIFRKVFFTPTDFTFQKIENSCVLSFSLDSSCYATILIDWLFSS